MSVAHLQCPHSNGIQAFGHSRPSQNPRNVHVQTQRKDQRRIHFSLLSTRWQTHYSLRNSHHGTDLGPHASGDHFCDVYFCAYPLTSFLCQNGAWSPYGISCPFASLSYHSSCSSSRHPL